MLPRSLLVFNKIAAIVASTLAYFVTTLPIAIGTRPRWPAVLTVLRSLRIVSNPMLEVTIKVVGD